MKEDNAIRPDGDLASTTRVWPGYVVAAAGTALAALLRWALVSTVGHLPLYITFYPVVFAAASIGGLGPGLVATILGALAGDILFTAPFGTLKLTQPAQITAVFFFVAVNVGISLLGNRLRSQTAALRERDTRLRLAHQVTRTGAFEWNLKTNVHTWSPELEAMYGLQPGQFSGSLKAWEDLVHPEDRAKARASVERALKSFQSEEAEWRVIWPDGTVHCLVGRFQAFPDAHGQPIRLVGTNIDITDRKKAEEAVQRSEERLRALVTATSYAVYRMNKDWTEMRQLEGQQFIPDTEVPSQSWLLKYIPGEDQPRVLAAIEDAIRNKKIFELEHRVRRADDTIGWTLSRAIPLLDAHGEIIEWFGAASDVTERKRLQEHLEEAVAERTAKLKDTLAELEYMSYSMIHDMRAPLRAMRGFAIMMEEDCEECRRPPAVEYLRRIRKSAARLDRLVTDALNYNKLLREDLTITPVDLGRLLRGMIESYPALQPPAADITIDFEHLTVLGNESLLTQCCGNLLNNAVKFVAPGIKPQIRIWAEASILNERGSTIISIQDNGIGIPKNLQEKLFGMFQRMHSSSDHPGTGIGLAIVKKAVERMNGRVGVDSSPGHGSRFWFELPNAIPTQKRTRLAVSALTH